MTVVALGQNVKTPPPHSVQILVNFENGGYPYSSVSPGHAYQSLSCETAINTDFSELFSLKRIYVKYKNAILSLIDCFVHT